MIDNLSHGLDETKVAMNTQERQIASREEIVEDLNAKIRELKLKVKILEGDDIRLNAETIAQKVVIV